MKCSVVLTILLVAGDFPIQGNPYYERFYGHPQNTGPLGFPSQEYPYYGPYHGYPQRIGPSGFPIQGYPYFGRYLGPPQSTGPSGFPIQGHPYYGTFRGDPQSTGALQSSLSPYKFDVKIETEDQPTQRFTSNSLPSSLSSVSDLLELLPILTGSLPVSLSGAKGQPFSGDNYSGFKKVETEGQPTFRFPSNSLPSSLSSVSGLLELLPSLTGSLPGAKGGSFSGDFGSIPGIKGTLKGSISKSLTGAIEGSISGTVSITANKDGKSKTTNYEIQDLEYTLSGGPSDATAAAKAIVRAARDSDCGILSDLTSGSVSGTLNGSIIVSSSDETGNVDSKTYNFDKLVYKVDGGDSSEDFISVGDEGVAGGSAGAFSSALREIAGDLGFKKA